MPIDLHDTECNTTGTKGIGEPATIPTAAAIANAFYHATGIRITAAPITPAKTVALLHQRKDQRVSHAEPVFVSTTATIEQAVEAAGRPGTRILAGGTDLLGCLRDGVFPANRLVSLNGLTALKGIRPRPGGGLRIGALTTLTEIAENRPGARILSRSWRRPRPRLVRRSCGTRGRLAAIFASARAAGISAATSIA